MSNKTQYGIGCPWCKKVTLVEAFPADVERYKAGANVSEAFPYLDASERELFITGICKECWESMTPTCDVCGAEAEDESVEWCGNCGNCREHCEKQEGCEP